MAKKFSTDEVNKLLKKKAFIRSAPPTIIPITATASVSPNQYYDANAPTARYQRVTQDQFLAELDPRSHDINNRTLYPDKVIDTTTKVNGIDTHQTAIVEIARVSVPLQLMIATKQCVHLWAKPPKFTSRRKANSDHFSRFKEYWTERNAQSALYLMAKSALTTGDGAIYFFMNNRQLSYTVWSYKTGDMLIPVYKKNGIDLQYFIRRYMSVEVNDSVSYDTIDIFDESTYTQMMLKGNKWVTTIEPQVHGFSQIPIAYHRESDVAWGQGQDLIDKIERLLSDVRESNAYFAFGILFLSGEDVTVMPPKTSQGKVIISEDANADAKLLEQHDLSPALKFEYEQYLKQLNRTTGTVVIDPEILKGGDQSGAYIKNLYNDAVQYAMDAKPYWQPVLDKIVAIVKEGLEIEDSNLDYRQLVVISEPDIYVPMNIAEEIRLVNESLTTGSISKETASQANYLSTPDEYARIKNEESEKLKAEAEANAAEDASKTQEPTNNLNNQTA